MLNYGPLAEKYNSEQARITRNMKDQIAPNLRVADYLQASRELDTGSLIQVLSVLQGSPVPSMPEAGGVRI